MPPASSLPSRIVPRLLGFPLALAALLALAGCHSFTGVSAQQRRALSQLTYPAGSGYGKNLDIVVVRRGSDIELVNRTARVYDNVQLWLNGVYVRRIKRLPIGTDSRYSLPTFIDRHEESFPVGSLLAPEKAHDVVLAEIYNPRTKQRERLFVRNPMKINTGARGRGQGVHTTSY